MELDDWSKHNLQADSVTTFWPVDYKPAQRSPKCWSKITFNPSIWIWQQALTTCCAQVSISLLHLRGRTDRSIVSGEPPKEPVASRKSGELSCKEIALGSCKLTITRKCIRETPHRSIHYRKWNRTHHWRSPLCRRSCQPQIPCNRPP